MRERPARIISAGAEGATPRETLRHQGPHRHSEIWREALHRRPPKGKSARSFASLQAKLSGTATDGDHRPGQVPGPVVTSRSERAPLMSHLAIIGAGITGVTTAFKLLERGFEVTLFDRQRYAAMETSYANGGQLSASNAEVWNSWSTVVKGLGWLFKRDAPLSLNLSPSWHKYAWLAEFVGNIPHYRSNTIATTRLAIEARAHLLAMARTAGIDFDLEQRGILHIYHDARDFERAARANALLEAGGPAVARSAAQRSAPSSPRWPAHIMAASSRHRTLPATSINSPAGCSPIASASACASSPMPASQASAPRPTVSNSAGTASRLTRRIRTPRPAISTAW